MLDVAHLLEPDGSIGVMLTDTVYGVVARASSPKAVARLYAVKGRGRDKPGTIIAASIDQIVNLGLKRRYLKPVESYWPGSISVLIPCGEELEYLHIGTCSLAVRIPDDSKLLEILRKTGPLLTTSANKPGKDTAVNVKQAKEYFGDKVDFYIDGGESKRKPSTIINVVDDEVVILRRGDVQLP